MFIVTGSPFSFVSERDSDAALRVISDECDIHMILSLQDAFEQMSGYHLQLEGGILQ